MPTHKYLDTTGLGQVWNKVKGYVDNKIVEVETWWEDIYSDWQAGYYYDENNNYAYTQIPTSLKLWEMPAYTSVSCTPFNNLIPVKSGERWKYYNNPPHFSDGIGVIPSIVIFDSEKQPIQAYKKGLSDNYTTEFTIPVGGTWMAVVYYNDQEYILQKLTTAKPYDEDELVNDIMASYRTYSLITPPVKKTLNKGYICFGTDDLRRGQTKQLHELYTNNNIPYYMAAIAGAAKGCVTDDPYKTNLDYMRMCVNNGGEIICHSADVITENNKTDFNTMYKYFCKNKK